MVDANDPQGSEVRSEPARIVAIVTCHDRLEHLRATLPTVASAFTTLVLDYNCPQQSVEWVRRYAAGAEDAIVHANVHARRVPAAPEGPPFWKPRALNLGAYYALSDLGATRLLFLDADTMVMNARELELELAELTDNHEDVFAMAGRVDGNDRPGLTGVLCCSDAAFLVAGGFDPIYTGWGMEDVDMRITLATSGCRARWLTPGLVRAIKHGDELRTKHRAPGQTPERSWNITRAAFLAKWSKRLGVKFDQIKDLPSELRALCFHNATIGGVYA